MELVELVYDLCGLQHNQCWKTAQGASGLTLDQMIPQKGHLFGMPLPLLNFEGLGLLPLSNLKVFDNSGGNRKWM